MPGGVFNGKLLEVLDLSQYTLKTLPVRTFCDMSTLRSLDLSFNTLNTLPVGVFSGLGSSTTLDLAEKFVAVMHPGA